LQTTSRTTASTACSIPAYLAQRANLNGNLFVTYFERIGGVTRKFCVSEIGSVELPSLVRYDYQIRMRLVEMVFIV